MFGKAWINSELKAHLRRALNAAGIDVHRLSPNQWRWSYHVDDYYSVEPTPRWGHGKPAHPRIAEVLNQQRNNIAALLRRFTQCQEIMTSVPLEGNSESTVPYWKNGWFENFDAATLVGMLACKAPKHYMEIGSGNSTKFARHTIEYAKLSTSIISLDPQPRATIDKLCDTVIRRKLEDCDLSIFDCLTAGDVLFFDGSHRTFTNSDVTVFFLELLPRLRPGVIIHIHDIFLPWDYLPEWGKRMYSEQYLLAAMLLCPQPLFKVLLPCFFTCNDPDLSVGVKTLVEPLGCLAQGWSFWVEKA